MLGVCCKEVRSEGSGITITKIDVNPMSTLQIVGARGLPQPKMNRGVKPLYCCTVRIQGDNEDFFQTRILRDVLDPDWLEDVGIEENELRQGLQFCILGPDSNGGIVHLGTASLPAAGVTQDGWNGDLPVHIAGDAIAYLTVRVKPAGNDYPQAKHQDFLIDVPPHQVKPLGCVFDSHDGKSLCIMALKRGAVQDYNQNVKPMYKVGYLDHVVRVNEVFESSTEMLKEIQTAPKLQLVVRRPKIFRTAIAAPDQDTLGMRFVDEASRGPWLTVRAVVTGPPQHMRPAQAWNAAHPAQSIRAGDRIIAVDGKQGKARDLFSRMRRAAKSSGGFNMTVVQLGNAGLEDDEVAAPIQAKSPL